MKEETQYEKVIKLLKNNKLIVFVLIVFSVVVSVSKFKSAILNIVPKSNESYCKKEEEKYLELANDMDGFSKLTIHNYSQILSIKTTLENLQELDRKSKDANCDFYKELPELYIQIKNNLLAINLSLIEKWNKNGKLKQDEDKALLLSSIIKKYMDNVNSFSKKEKSIIDSTLIMLER